MRYKLFDKTSNEPGVLRGTFNQEELPADVQDAIGADPRRSHWLVGQLLAEVIPAPAVSQETPAEADVSAPKE